MTSDDARKRASGGARILGLTAVACAACCAGPVLGALGAVGIASLAGYAVAGVGAALLAAGLVVAAWSLARRRRRRRCSTPGVRLVPRSEREARRLAGDGVRR